MSRLAELRTLRVSALVAMICPPALGQPKRGSASIIPTECGDEPADRALGRTGLGDWSDVAEVAAAGHGQQSKTDERRKSRPAVRIRQAGNLLRTPDAHRAAEHALHVI